MATDSTWILYGATGYTGRLIAERAISLGMRPILAGRDAEKLQPLASQLSLELRSFALDDPALAARHLEGASLVLNCAGPFVRTAPTMMSACLAAKVHYLDITGEIPVIEYAHDLDAKARSAGIVLMPAVGFDVVPTDCLAAMLAQRLPGATQLELAFASGGALSPGTAKTLVLSLPDGGRIRRDGKIVHVPLGWKTREIPFRDRMRFGMSIPWGDVASAYYSTGIPNIRVYIETSPRRVKRLRRLKWLAPLLRFSWAQQLAEQRIEARIKGPSPQQRERQKTMLWGEVSDGSGNRVSATMITPSGYELTVRTSLEIVRRVLLGGASPGFATPSKAFGAKFILEFDGVDVEFK